MTDPGLPVEEERAVGVASVAQRVGGALVDGLLTSMVVVVPLILGLIRTDDLEKALSPGWAAVLVVFGATYTIVPVAIWGQTLGKLAVGTRIVAESDGSVPGWRRSAIRWAVPGFAGRLPFVGLWVSLAVMGSLVLDRRRRGLHDKAAGTIVVRA